MSDEKDAFVCDLENYDKNLNKVKTLTKILNNFIVSERQVKLYLEEFGKLPKEYPVGTEGHLQWTNSIERSRYVKKVTEANPTHSAKRPSRSKKEVTPPSVHIPWTPPKDK